MSYAVIRNEKYKMSNLPSIGRHNERKNEKYGNEDIDRTRSNENYHFKEPMMRSYEKEFQRLKEENNLKGNLRLTGAKQSNVACEFIITSDKEFFDKLGAEKTKEFFKDSYDFACKKCGEQNIISAVVHMDERTPHMHLTYIPVVKDKDKLGNSVQKVNCSKFWKGFNSYGVLQDEFYKHCKEHGYDLERGEMRAESREHLTVTEYKIKAKTSELKEKQRELVKLQSIDTKVELKAEKGKLTYSTKEVNAIIEQNKALKLKTYDLESKINQLETTISRGQKARENLLKENGQLKLLHGELNDLRSEKECLQRYLKIHENTRNELKPYTDYVDRAYKSQSRLREYKGEYIKCTAEIEKSIENTRIIAKDIEKTTDSMNDLRGEKKKIDTIQTDISTTKGQIANLSVLNFKRKKVLADNINRLTNDERALTERIDSHYSVSPSNIDTKLLSYEEKIQELKDCFFKAKETTEKLEKTRDKIALNYKGAKSIAEATLPKQLQPIVQRGYNEIKGTPSQERSLNNLSNQDKEEILSHIENKDLKTAIDENWNQKSKSVEKNIAPKVKSFEHER